MADSVAGLDAELRERLEDETRNARDLVLRHRFSPEHSESASLRLLEYEAIRTQLARSEGQRSLLLFEPAADELAGCFVAIGVGDVAAAEHVSVYVPGNHTTILRSIAGMATEAKALVETGNQLLPCRSGGKLAAVFWLGYHCPQTDSAVLTEGRAKEGVPALRRFLAELDRLRGADFHVSLIGHSYGSLVTGLAMWQPCRVTDLIVVGSPGVGTSDPAGDWQAQPRLWTLKAHGDLVASLERFGPSPDELSGAVRLSTGPGKYTDCSGEQIDLASIDSHSRHPFNRSHLRYNEPGTTSHFNQAMVAAGLYEAVVPYAEPPD
ncbi:MAG: alpha/beta hydrolase [Segniliparus sp.]|uniref:alpha/beta hydrolase n=1 Tax=Segniliparus sp. TaxID=2804064 RepID=UPI003F2A1274